VSSGETDVTTEKLEQVQAVLHVAPMLFGTYRHHVDEKGRVAVPASLRRFLPEGSVVAPGPDTRLMICPPGLWARERELFLRTAETPAQERRFMRTLSENASVLEIDAQGRLLLTAGQRSFAQIVDQVVFLGVGASVEIVADEIYQSEHSTVQPAEYTQFWDVVHQRGASAPSSPA
jgi:MraZ protein